MWHRWMLCGAGFLVGLGQAVCGKGIPAASLDALSLLALHYVVFSPPGWLWSQFCARSTGDGSRQGGSTHEAHSLLRMWGWAARRVWGGWVGAVCRGFMVCMYTCWSPAPRRGELMALHLRTDVGRGTSRHISFTSKYIKCRDVNGASRAGIAVTSIHLSIHPCIHPPPYPFVPSFLLILCLSLSLSLSFSLFLCGCWGFHAGTDDRRGHPRRFCI